MRTALASPKLRVSAPMAIALHISFDDVVRAPHKSSSHIRNSFPGAFFPPIEELDDSDDSSSQQVSPKHAKQHKRSTSNFAASYSGHHISRDSTPSGQRPKARKVGDTDKEARSSRRVQSDKDFESIARRQNSALTMLQPSNGLAPHDRKASIVSNASSRSYSHDATSTPTMAMIAQEREANMRTPRPHTASAAQTASAKQRVEPGLLAEAPEAVSQKDHSRILQWQQRRDPSDATIEANEPARTYYPSDSLGRMSVASSAFASGSEYGPSLRTGSESGHDWAATSVTSGSGAQRRGRKVAPPELLVVVRPPPSKQGNPLNLQIQLVTPQAPSGAASPNGQGRISGESSRDELVPPGSSSSIVSITNGASAHGGLRRSNSVSSSRSAISDASSAGFSSVSASSSSRRVTPLYNLCFHSIMPTTVTDAGTDQKVAKFSKRGVEIDGLGILVPHELALGVNDLSTLERRRRSSAALSGGPASETSASLVSSDNQAHPDVRSEASSARGVSATSDSGGSGKGLPPSEKAGEPPTSFDAMSPQAKEPVSDPMGGLGGKLMRGFKRFSLNPVINAPTPPKRETGAAPSVRSASTLDTTAPTSILARMRGAAVKMKDGESIASEMMEGLGSDYTSATGDMDLEVPQLVVGAGIRGDGSRRTQGYYWTVKKWNRRLDEDDDLAGDNVPGRHEHGANPILNSVWKRFNLMNRMGGTEQHPPSHQIPVRFEWTRQEMRRRSGHASASNSSAAARNNNTAGGGHGRAATDMGGALASNGRRSMRTSIDVRPAEHESVPTSNASEADGLPSSDAPALRLHPGKSSSRPSSVYSAGGVSPVRGSLDRGGEESDPEDSETTWACHLVLGPTTRIPIGILAPTPHHPKLVAQLTVPYPLPDLSQSGLGADGAGLTREELKDIISVTSLFVIVREAFGGLAKRRKGDSALKFGAAVAQRQ